MASGGAQIFYEPSSVNCSGTDYTQASVNAAALEALQLASEKKTLGRDKYPHAYNDYEHFKFPHAVKPYLEFPILSNGQVYSGGSPGADRVVLGSIAADFSSAIYCGTITHSGESDNAFQMCRDDTMNVHGQGNDIAARHDQGGAGAEAGHHKHHSPHNRRLIDRIDL